MNDLLISTITGLVLWQNNQMKMIAHGNYYGLTWDDNFIYCSFNPQHRNVTEIEVFDANLSRVGKLDTSELRGVHQIFWWDNELHIVNTSMDTIFVYASDKMCRFNWTGFNEDHRHINSIWINDDYIYVAEGMTSHQEGDPTIQVLSHQYKPIKRFRMKAAIQIHNIYVENSTLYSLGKFGLVKKDIDDNNYIITDLRTDKSNGFLRGFARSEMLFYIGESQILPREKRPYGDSRILVLNNKLKIIRTIELKDTGQIQDIRIINAPDLAHNGIIFEYQRPETKRTDKDIPLI